MKNILFIALTLLLGIAKGAWADTTGNWQDNCDSSWGSGYGANTEFTISTAAQLAKFASMVNAENNFSGKTVTLSADLDLSAHYWTPIGSTEAKYFAGTFDGQGHTISGIIINSESERQGLFGTLGGGTIRNLKLSASTITLATNASAAGIVANIKKGANTSTIENCHVTSDVSIDTQGHAGGIAGYVYSGTVIIRGCTSAATIILRHDSYQIGGIIGHCGYTGTQGDYASNITVTNCLYYGSSLSFAEGYTGVVGAVIGGYYSNSNYGGYSTVTFSNNYYTYPNAIVKGIGLESIKSGENTTDNSNLDIVSNNAAVCAHVVSASDDIADMGTAGASVANGITPYTYGIEYGGTYYSHVLALLNNADNSELISQYAGKTFNVKLRGRTLYKDGFWNTLCLPFNFTLSGDMFADASKYEVKELDTYQNYYFKDAFDREDYSNSFKTGVKDGKLYLFFKKATNFYAGNPYLVKWKRVEGYNQNDPATYDYVNPVFENVTISDAAPTAVTSEDGKVSFTPIYAPISRGYADRSILFVGIGNSLYYPDGSGTISLKSFRAYFQLNGVQMPDSSSSSGDDDGDDYIPYGGGEVKAFVLDIEDDATSIKNEQLKIKNEEGEWYSLDGRKLTGKPSVRGIYVTDGRKVVIK